jgi:transposase-like protein
MNCVYCESKRIVKNGKDQAAEQKIQTYRCNDSGRRFNERSGTPMARLRTAPEVFALAMKVRSEGLGLHCYRSSAEQIRRKHHQLGETSIVPGLKLVAAGTRRK